MSRERRRRPLLAGVLLAGVSAALMAGWWAANDRVVCEETGVFACAGPGILMALVGVPVALVVGGLCFRLAGARSALLGLALVGAAGWGLVLASEVAEPPLWVWPVVVGALSAAYVALEGRLLPPPH